MFLLTTVRGCSYITQSLEEGVCLGERRRRVVEGGCVGERRRRRGGGGEEREEEVCT